MLTFFLYLCQVCQTG